MFTMGHCLQFTLFFAALVLANSSHERRGPHVHHHLAVDHLTEREAHVQKRFDNTRFTFFQVGLNACGSFDHNRDFVVALNTHQWDGGSHCYEEITVTYKGKSTKAKITDECVGCPYAAIDLSPGLFRFLIPGGLSIGQVYGEWAFGHGDAHVPPASHPPPQYTHIIHKTTSTISTTTATTIGAHQVTPTTHSTSTTLSSPLTGDASMSRISTALTTTIISWDTGNLNQLNLALIQLVDLSSANIALSGECAL